MSWVADAAAIRIEHMFQHLMLQVFEAVSERNKIKLNVIDANPTFGASGPSRKQLSFGCRLPGICPLCVADRSGPSGGDRWGGGGATRPNAQFGVVTPHQTRPRGELVEHR